MKPTIQTATGLYFNFRGMTDNEIVMEDLASALSKICRFTGHCKEFYSVAQHSVMVSYIVPPQFTFQGLMHDAHEAYVGDVSSPLKQLIADYKKLERQVESRVRFCYGLPYELDPSVKEADLVALVTERRDLMPSSSGNGEWSWLEENYKPLPFTIVPWEHRKAKAEFIRRFDELYRRRTAHEA